jgi:uncharacterized membrane protein
MKKIYFLGLIVVSVFAIQCVKHKAAQDVGACDPNTIYYTKDIKPILNSSCAVSGCHDSKSKVEGLDFSNYSGAYNTSNPGQPQSSDLYKVITSTGKKQMPPNGYPSLDSMQLSMIYKWILQGAKNEICTDNASCDTTNAKYSTTISSILKTNCVGCHNSTNTSGGIDISNYSEVNNLVSNGKLVGTINFKSGYSQMPPSGTQLSLCDRSKIERWIANGSKNN